MPDAEDGTNVDRRGLATIRCSNVVTPSAEASGVDAITRLVALALARWRTDRDVRTLRIALVEALQRLEQGDDS